MDFTISNAELVVMRLLWKKSPLNARKITKHLHDEKQWHRKTVNTLLSRLEKKSAVQASVQDDGIKYFTPQLSEATYMQAATSHFVDRLFDGNITPLIASFAGGRTLKSKEIAELQRLLEELSDDK